MEAAVASAAAAAASAIAAGAPAPAATAPDPGLRVVVMSATLDVRKFAEFFAHGRDAPLPSPTIVGAGTARAKSTQPLDAPSGDGEDGEGQLGQGQGQPSKKRRKKPKVAPGPDTSTVAGRLLALAAEYGGEEGAPQAPPSAQRQAKGQPSSSASASSARAPSAAPHTVTAADLLLGTAGGSVGDASGGDAIDAVLARAAEASAAAAACAAAEAAAAEGASDAIPPPPPVQPATIIPPLSGGGFPVAVLTVPGRTFPVEVFYTPDRVDSYLDAAVATVLQVHSDAGEAPGDVLVFLPGQEDIEDAATVLRGHAASLGKERAAAQAAASAAAASSVAAAAGGSVEAAAPPPPLLELRVCTLYASLSHEAQLAAFEPPPAGTRKVILATNIAETSVTINGVRHVVDAGKVKVRGVVAGGPSGGPNSSGGGGGTGLESLATVDVSQAQAIQRAGRAGREAPGVCYRLMPESDFLALPPLPVPEVQRVSLSAVLLQLLAMGLTGADVLGFPWLDAPPRDAMNRALTQLAQLGAIEPVSAATAAGEEEGAASAPSSSTSGAGGATPSAVAAALAARRAAPSTGSALASGSFRLTPTGRTMAALPLEPLYSSLLLAAAKRGAGAEATAIVALLSVESVWTSPGRDKQGALDAARRKFTSLEGDHVTLLNVFRAFERVVAASARAVAGEAASRAAVARGDGSAAGAGPRIVNFREGDVAAPTSGAGAVSDASGAAGGAGQDGGAGLDGGRLEDWTGSAGASARRDQRQAGEGDAAAAGAAAGGAGPKPSSLSAPVVPSLSARSCARAIAEAMKACTDAAAPSTAQSAQPPPKQGQPHHGRSQHQGHKHRSDKPSAEAGAAARAGLRGINTRVGGWCGEHFLSLRALRKAVAIRDQLADIAASGGVGLDLTPSCGGDTEPLRRALVAGCWLSLAQRQPGDSEAGRPVYRTLGGVSVTIHPTSTLVLAYSHLRNRQAAAAAAAQRRGGSGPAGAAVASAAALSAALGGGDAGGLLGYPDCVVYDEVVRTGRGEEGGGSGVAGGKAYMRNVTRVEQAWLPEEWPGGAAAAAAAGMHGLSAAFNGQ